MKSSPADTRRMLDLESDVASAEKRIMGLEGAVTNLIGVIEWMLVRYAKATDKADIKQTVMPRLDRALQEIT